MSLNRSGKAACVVAWLSDTRREAWLQAGAAWRPPSVGVGLNPSPARHWLQDLGKVLSSLCFNFFICKVGINWVTLGEALGWCLAHWGPRKGRYNGHELVLHLVISSL